jgi:hypothetical protein
MSIIHVNHIKTHIARTYRQHIDCSDLVNRPQQDQEDAFFSRALAAFALEICTGNEPTILAKRVIDGHGDNGIDAVRFDETEKILYVVQSKWIANGNGSVTLGDGLKFLRGFRDLLDADFGSFNARFNTVSAEVTLAIEDPNCRFVLVFAYTGQQPLAREITEELEKTTNELNDPTELVSVRVLGQRELHAAVSGAAEGTPVSFDVMLLEWGQIREPYQAYDGLLKASDVAAWHSKWGDKLFAQNLRKVISGSEVNRTMMETLRTSPEKFWYFNNGITALCQSIRKKPIGGADRATGVFACEGVSIVNGAQTVGAIAETMKTHPANVNQAVITARFISLEGCPEGFGNEVTRATNTQNRIDAKDFASLDPEQDRLRREMRLEGREYAFKTGDPTPPPECGCTIDEATVALACSRDVALAVLAKREVGKLWENIEKAPYKLLFNPSLSGLRLWRTVELLRIVDEELRAAQERGKPRTVAVHGNRFIAHQVLRRLKLEMLDDPAGSIDLLKVEARGLVSPLVASTCRTIEALYPNAYVQALFKNATKCKEMDAKMAEA